MTIEYRANYIPTNVSRVKNSDCAISYRFSLIIISGAELRNCPFYLWTRALLTTQQRLIVTQEVIIFRDVPLHVHRSLSATVLNLINSTLSPFKDRNTPHSVLHSSCSSGVDHSRTFKTVVASLDMPGVLSSLSITALCFLFSLSWCLGLSSATSGMFTTSLKVPD